MRRGRTDRSLSDYRGRLLAPWSVSKEGEASHLMGLAVTISGGITGQTVLVRHVTRAPTRPVAVTDGGPI